MILYDTVSRRKVPLAPIEPGRVRVYTCGPTVYRYAHIGNLRTYLLTDLLLRTLRCEGYATFAVQNITDMGHMHEEALDRVEDKVIAAARKAGKSAREIADFFTEAYFGDCRRMGFLPADVFPRASAHVPDMIAMVAELDRRGFAYGEGGYRYFDVSRADGYGALSGARIGEGAAAERTDTSIHRHKRRPEDFALWLAAEPGREFSWESPWGTGWPGWHIECAAMAVKYLGSDFDVHVGGIDLRFPHHENERAMARAATGGRFASIWLHAAHLLVDGHKMSKSLKNEYLLDDLAERGFRPSDYRYYCLTVHYRTPMNFTWAGQAAAAKGLARLREAFARPSPARGGGEGAADGFRRRFREALSDDLNAPRALAVVHEAARAGLPGGILRDLAREWDGALGPGLAEEPAAEVEEPDAARGAGPPAPAEVLEMLRRRDACRASGDFSGADALRKKIREAGYDVVDTRGAAARLARISRQGS